MQFNVLRCTKEIISPITLSITFFNPKILGLLFCSKNSLTWAVNWIWTIKLQENVENLLETLQKLYTNGTVI